MALTHTTGSRGFRVDVPIVRGLTQRHIWDFAQRVALALAVAHPALLTAAYLDPEAAGLACPGRAVTWKVARGIRASHSWPEPRGTMVG